MESAWGSPYTEGGGGQPGLHSKHYLAMEQDVHYKAGMLCQDCHTSGDVHGDRFLSGTNLGMVEIECSDCHGTPQAYPWELPLGWGDENEPGEATGPGRGVLDEVPSHLEAGTVHEARDGYLVTARGNPMPDVVRDGSEVVVHTAGGKDIRLSPLKRSLEQGELSLDATVAMVSNASHINSMECYSCHTSWAPQCYGCHVKVDFSEGKRAFDWVAAGQKHQDPEHAADPDESAYETWLAGEITEMRSYLRWEDPALGINGEGRVSPIVPGCQVSVTVVGEDGETVVRNQMFRTPPTPRARARTARSAATCLRSSRTRPGNRAAASHATHRPRRWASGLRARARRPSPSSSTCKPPMARSCRPPPASRSPRSTGSHPHGRQYSIETVGRPRRWAATSSARGR